MIVREIKEDDFESTLSCHYYMVHTITHLPMVIDEIEAKEVTLYEEATKFNSEVAILDFVASIMVEVYIPSFYIRRVFTCEDTY